MELFMTMVAVTQCVHLPKPNQSIFRIYQLLNTTIMQQLIKEKDYSFLKIFRYIISFYLFCVCVTHMPQCAYGRSHVGPRDQT